MFFDGRRRSVSTRLAVGGVAVEGVVSAEAGAVVDAVGMKGERERGRCDQHAVATLTAGR